MNWRANLVLQRTQELLMEAWQIPSKKLEENWRKMEGDADRGEG